jgi:hypothetical protein
MRQGHCPPVCPHAHGEGTKVGILLQGN